ncbi:hypothetical protein [Sinorhizobium meliloti]|uniref:hypothetical protein n=1 Tax=Rhizobium meliloti TaxID=382 RepID=UPI0004A2AF39|nr:hypothetical protein [Sinorhizobium meliloti]ARS70112.1 hypothetical protein SMRU11_23965 [Sinorhizobium meliloti RU11/001]
MPKISFDAEPFGVTTGTHYGNVGGPASGCAFKPVVGAYTGIEAIIEGLRLADIECRPSEGTSTLAKEIDTRDGVKNRPDSE